MSELGAGLHCALDFPLASGAGTLVGLGGGPRLWVEGALVGGLSL